MSNEVSKKEFLKRYLEEESSRKRKKKSKLIKPKANVPSLKIVDEDIDLKRMNFGENVDGGDDDDEAPVVAEIIDERPVEVKLKELYDSSRWKKIDKNESSQSDLPDEQRIKTHKTSRRHDSDGDLSPLRESSRNSNMAVFSPQKHNQNKTRHDSDSDISPPRNQKKSKSKHKFDSDVSSLQSQKHIKNKHASDSDLSPPRSSQTRSGNKHNSDSDLSPPRSSQKRSGNKRNSDSDLSPPRSSQKRSGNKRNSDSDLSPPRSQKRSGNKRNSDSDLSPPRNQKKSRNEYNSGSNSPSHSYKDSRNKGKSKLGKTLSGLKAGLQDSKSMQEEVQELKRREKSRLNMLDDEISGKNAAPILRDRRTGKIRDLNKEQEIKDMEEKKNKEYQQKYEKWGKGTEQRQEHLEKIQDDVYEMSKPLARYEDDADLDERLKSIIHDDDPMSAYMKKKKQKEAGTSNFPVYAGPPAPPNRFSLKPGYRWDGVDRSNGFEAKYFAKINSTKAIKEEAYLWSIQDM